MVYANFSSTLPAGLQHFEFVDLTIIRTIKFESNQEYALSRSPWKCIWTCRMHYNDVIMTTMTSQITTLTVVYSIVYSDADQRKHQSSASLAFEVPAHRISYAENISIWWRHHGMPAFYCCRCDKVRQYTWHPQLSSVYEYFVGGLKGRQTIHVYPTDVTFYVRPPAGGIVSAL